MNEPLWYVIDKDGQANIGWSRMAAAAYAVNFDQSYPSVAPHRVAQLVDADEIKRAHKRIAELEAVLRAADDYLSAHRYNDIGSGSILHRRMQDALPEAPKE
jgi:hypothetical protein